MFDLVPCAYNDALEDAVSTFTTQFPPDVVQNWERQAELLAKKVERDIVLLMEMKRRLAAVEIMAHRVRTGKTMEEMTAPEAVLFCIGHFDEPITLSRLRDYLEISGFPMERFGRNCSHFYVVIRRLARQGRIHKDGDEVSLSLMGGR
jgi:hypothetical protein